MSLLADRDFSRSLSRYPYFLYAVPKSATCAAFIKESRMELLQANQLHRKYGL